MAQFRKKAAWIILGFIVSISLLEIVLRIGGLVFISLQEHRNKITVQKNGAYRIMCLGESTTAGGLDDNGYPEQLEKVLNQRHIGIKFSVINKGVAGANTSTLLSQLEDNLDKYKPDIVIAMMGINDRGIQYYKDIPRAEKDLFFNKFKAYKFARLLWAHIMDKNSKKKIYKLDNKDMAYAASCLAPKNDMARKNIIKQDEEILEKKKSNRIDGNVFIKLGDLYMTKGKPYQAEKLFKKAIKLNPMNSMAYVRLAALYRDWICSSEAENIFNKAVELDPKNYIAYAEFGIYFKWQGKFDRAEEEFKKAIRVNPIYQCAYLGLGEAYLLQHKFSQAEEVLRKAIRLGPDNDKIYASLAIVYKETDRYALAKIYFNKANKVRMERYSPLTNKNYWKLKDILDRRGIKLVCAQYPMRSIEPLKNIFNSNECIVFVDNEKIFKEAFKVAPYNKYFIDMFGGDFGHCTRVGNRLLAENIANVILKNILIKKR